MYNLPKDKKIILFDGFCNLCDASVQFIIKRDKKDVFRFVSLQSELGVSIVKRIGINPTKTDSIILYEPAIAYYFKAEACIKIAKALGGIYYSFVLFSILPKALSNSIYDFIAKNRYNWFGKKEHCQLPTAELQAKFLA